MIVEPDRPAPPTAEELSRLQQIEALLDQFVATQPTPGYFYPVQDGDTLPAVAQAALATIGPHTAAARMSYIHCLQSGTFNLGRYGTPSTSKDFPAELLIPGKGLGVRVAFRGRNADALELMADAVMPKMTVDPISGAPRPPGPSGVAHTSLGVLWLPPVSAQSLALGEPTCAPYSWADGSSTIDPPPELMALLEAA